MLGFDLKNGVVSGASLVPTTVTTNTLSTGSAVDLTNGSVISIAVLNVGAVSGTSPTLDLKLQSNTTSATTGFTDVSGATFTQVTTSNKRQVITFTLPPGSGYVRVTGTVSGTTPSFLASVDVFSVEKFVQPTGAEGDFSRSPST